MKENRFIFYKILFIILLLLYCINFNKLLVLEYSFEFIFYIQIISEKIILKHW